MSDTIKALTETVRGRVIIASDPDYDDARAVYNAMYDRRPHAVVQCTDSADVMAVIAAARDRGGDLAIRGGGHSVPGFGTVDDGLVIDLSPMKGVRVDPAKKVAWVGGGATWGMSTTRPTRSASPRPAPFAAVHFGSDRIRICSGRKIPPQRNCGNGCRHCRSRRRIRLELSRAACD